ncbi:unnamed protein product [Amoebophrya sp. A25]|nr:unnamed protein product [Amoebophrya sp. A25]|eukprot:GSA25T00002272001.1
MLEPNNPDHIPEARNHMENLMDNPSQWQEIFRNAPVLRTLYRYHQSLFSCWHPCINHLVNAPTPENICQLPEDVVEWMFPDQHDARTPVFDSTEPQVLEN